MDIVSKNNVKVKKGDVIRFRLKPTSRKVLEGDVLDGGVIGYTVRFRRHYVHQGVSFRNRDITDRWYVTFRNRYVMAEDVCVVEGCWDE